MADETETNDEAQAAAGPEIIEPPTTTDETAADRILNQEEIDSLLGFDVNDDQIQDKSGVRPEARRRSNR